MGIQWLRIQFKPTGRLPIGWRRAEDALIVSNATGVPLSADVEAHSLDALRVHLASSWSFIYVQETARGSTIIWRKLVAVVVSSQFHHRHLMLLSRYL